MTVREYVKRQEYDICPECASAAVVPQFPRDAWNHWREYCKDCEWKSELKKR